MQTPPATTAFSIDGMDPLLVAAIVVLAGTAGGWIARQLRVPAITGNIVIGAALSLTLLRGTDWPRMLEPLTMFATSLIAVTVGAQFSFRRVRTALRRIIGISLFEAGAAFLAVQVATVFSGATWISALLLGSMAISTAPATTLAVVREMRAKGPFVKTLLGVVALDAAAAIGCFGFAQTLAANYFADSGPHLAVPTALLVTAGQLAGSAIIGLIAGAAVERLVHVPALHKFSVALIAVLVCSGLARFLDLSPLIACLVLGICLGNRSRESERLGRAFEPLEPTLYTCFFTLSGMSIHLDILLNAGVLCGVYVAARCVGKMAGSFVGARVTRCSARIANNIPIALIPQAGVVLGLITLLQSDPHIPADVSSRVASLVIAAVTIQEIFGPLFTRMALVRTKEAGLDRPRLMEFVQEEFILTNLQAADKWDALRKLTDFFATAHRLDKDQTEQLYASVVEREEQFSTAIGHGAAIPHGRVEISDSVEGVLGISRDGVEFDAPDGQPVKLIMLIATPKEHERRHLEVMAGLTSMVGDPLLRQRLIAAVDPNDAWEIIEEVGAREYNYFLEGSEEESS